jgi:hypothetical protein
MKCKKCKGNCKPNECLELKKNTKIVELVIDKDYEQLTIDAISLVENPAIEVDFVYLNKQKNNLTFSKIDEEKRLLISPALIPNKQIYRYDADTDTEFYVYFSTSTVKKASELFLKHNNHHSATYEHEQKIAGVETVESWIIDDPNMDKSKVYGFNLPKGTWMVSMRITSNEIWEKIKNKEVKGLSIEGFFVDRMQAMSSKTKSKEEILKALADILNLESYDNYPKGARDNAERAIKENEERGNKCATQTGKVRAQQLAQGKAISYKTVKRVYSYLKRAKAYDSGDYNDCGTISFNLWGGDVMMRWAEKIINEVENQTA